MYIGGQQNIPVKQLVIMRKSFVLTFAVNQSVNYIRVWFTYDTIGSPLVYFPLSSNIQFLPPPLPTDTISHEPFRGVAAGLFPKLDLKNIPYEDTVIALVFYTELSSHTPTR